MTSLTLNLPYNDLDAVSQAFQKHSQDIAAVIVEPVAGNMGVVPPAPGFLEGLRALCDKYGSVLIFDEVITGFRLALGGAQEYFGITPDLTCMGKIIGGGLPLAAYGGKNEIMNQIAPKGPVYQAGTLSGNPLATAAGLAVLELLQGYGVYDQLEEKAARLYNGMLELFTEKGVDHTGNRVGSMFTVFFQKGPVTDFVSATRSDADMFAKYYRALLAKGVYMAPSPFEATFVSLAHQEDDIDQILGVCNQALEEITA
jgi:glutamate-1-semialdehyde 2,1-aminomutase